MNVVAIPTVDPGPEPVNSLAGLLEQRDHLAAEHDRLLRFDAAHAEADAALAAIAVAERALDDAEAAEMAAWSRNPDGGDPPAPMTDERRLLEQRRTLAAADARSAAARRQGVQRRMEEIAAELRAIGQRIFAARLDAVMTEARELDEQIQADAAALRTLLVRMFELSRMLTDARAAAAAAGGDQAIAGMLHTAKSELDRFGPPALNATAGDIEQAAKAWEDMFT